MLVWGGPLAVSGEGSVIRAGDWVRLDVTSYPASASKSANVPPRFYSLGVVGTIAGDYRSPGVRITYELQGAMPLEPTALAVYWVLPLGVAGNLYQGVDVSGIPAFGCILDSNTTQVVADNTDTPQAWNVETYDPWGMYNAGGSPGVITIVAPGTYYLRAGIYWGGSGSGLRLYSVRRNGVDIVAQLRTPPPGASEFTQIVEWTGILGVGDTLEVVAYQNSGAPITTYNGLGSFVAECWRLAESPV